MVGASRFALNVFLCVCLTEKAAIEGEVAKHIYTPLDAVVIVLETDGVNEVRRVTDDENSGNDAAVARIGDLV